MEKEKIKLRNKRGITLVALVITIIVLIILAGVSINAVLNDGLIGNAKEVKSEYDVAKEKEKIALIDLEVQTDFVTKITRGYANKEEGISKYTPYLFRNGYLTGVTVNIRGVAETVKSLQIKLPEGYYVFAMYANENTIKPIDNPETTPVATGMLLMKGETEESANKVGSIIVYGDVSENGNIDSTDSSLLQSWLNGGGSVNIIAADVNHDGIVNDYDMQYIFDYSIGEVHISQDAYALSLEELVLEDFYTIRNKCIEELRKKFTVEYMSWEYNERERKGYAITDTVSTTTMKDILDILPYDNLGICSMSTKEVFKKGSEKSKTEIVQGYDFIVLITGENLEDDGNLVYNKLNLGIHIIKQ